MADWACEVADAAGKLMQRLGNNARIGRPIVKRAEYCSAPIEMIEMASV